MNGRIVGIVLIAATVTAGAGMWYAQEYGFYARIDPANPAAVLLVQTPDGPQRLDTVDFQGIDANSSPIRWRGCFRLATPLPADALPFEGATPLIGPRWFECFDAHQIGADLQSGVAMAYLSQSEIRPDVDRVLAVYPDGRAYGWQQFNEKSPARGVMD